MMNKKNIKILIYLICGYNFFVFFKVFFAVQHTQIFSKTLNFVIKNIKVNI